MKKSNKNWGSTLFLMCVCVITISSSCKKDELPSENKDKGTSLKLNNSGITIGAAAGTAYISVTSNTDWVVYVNNSGDEINGLDVSPMSGKNDGTVKVKYDAVPSTTSYHQTAVIVFYYYSYGIKLNETVVVSRHKY